jgi:uncharacterized protein
MVNARVGRAAELYHPCTMRSSATRASFGQILQARLSRRDVLRAGGALAAAGAASGWLAGCALPPASSGALTFAPIAASDADALRVPPGYTAQVLLRWGDPIGMAAGSPAFKTDAANSAAEQALQAGMHHDGMQFFPLPQGANGSLHGLLALNHEYFDGVLLHADGQRTGSLEKTRKEQHSVGVSIVEVQFQNGRWTLIRPSRYARRIHALTPIAIGGPAADAPLLRTALDPSGREALGTFAGCAHGWTPWGTYLTCEENFQFMFAGLEQPTPDQQRYLLPRRARYGWGAFDPRFDVAQHPNEFHRFGWVVEIDPFDAASKPVKRTALGRFSHEGAAPSVDRDRRMAWYMGDDQPFEYVYKFVARDAWNPTDRTANRDLLDHGTLYAARFDADGRGEWLPLVAGAGPLTAANGFPDQATVLVRTRQAAEAVGATPMDRPEWAAVHPVSGEVYCTLTNNALRGRPGHPGANAANPRVQNAFGHIVRWREAGASVAATRFEWDLFALGGDPRAAEEAQRGKFTGDAFGSPDGLYFDSRGILWVATDVSPTVLNRGAYAALGNNQLLAVDPRDGTFKRFLTGPRGCEITGVTGTPDGRTLFLNVQHPGEGPSANDPDQPRRFSNWPDFDPAGRPRSATVVIRRDDGGVIGT